MKPKINRRNFLAKSTIGFVGTGTAIMSNNLLRSPGPAGALPQIKEYRVLGRTGFKVSDIGCGPAMMSDENLLRAVLKTGVNVIDTAEFYGNGNNEKLIGQAIKNTDRASLFINTKLMISEYDTVETIVDRVRKCLERLETEYLDGLMLWNPDSSEKVKNEAFHEAFNQLQNEGRARFCGVSCHGTEYPGFNKDTMEKIILSAVEDGRFDHVLFVYNYTQQEMGANILKECANKNIGVMLMKTDPLSKRYLDVISQVNNLLNENKPVNANLKQRYDLIIEKQKKAEEFLKNENLFKNKSTSEAAVAFALDSSIVGTVLITFSNYEEIEQYISYSGIKVSSSVVSTLNKLRDNYSHLYCRHACGICESHCPYHVPINTIMRFNHYFISQKREKYAMEQYHALKGRHADHCSQCEGFCESACPFEVSIQTLLTVANLNLKQIG